MTDSTYLIAMVLSLSIISALFILVQLSKNKKQIHKIISLLLGGMFIWTLSLIMQLLYRNNPSVDPLLFEGFASFGACFVPIFFLLLGFTFSKTKLNWNWKYLLLFIVPCITTVLMFTNNYHHLLYKHYSIYLNETVAGPYMIFHSIYSYLLILIGIYEFLRYSIKNSGFFSKQSILIVIGTLIPIILNVVGSLGLVPMAVYITPISFSIALIFYAFAIFKFKFLNITPIALQNIVDRISDGYLVLNEDNIITDFNKTFFSLFKLHNENIRNMPITEFLKSLDVNVNLDKLVLEIESVKNTNKTASLEKSFEKIHKCFTIEITSIYSKTMFIGTLILFKDITQHVNDMKKIHDNQETLMEKERLASLGQLIGGIAHNLKTPIMSISGAAEALTDLTKEYDSSIDDPEVNSQDHHDIAKDMFTWISKIKTHTEYMSDVITAVKGQAVVLSNEDDISFTVGELLKRVDILMKHELKTAIIYLNISMKTDENTIIDGDINSLVQVINNMISNSIQAYNGKPEQNIDIIVTRENNNLIIAVKDYGSGLPKEVKKKLFREMVTTKGKNGTGLGLYMSYSTIRAHFNGNITFESEEGKGTTFIITLPLKK